MSDSHEPTGFLAPDPADLNQLFPGYEIERLIATGGMGAVYCAIQKSLDRTVALKILPQEFSKDAAFCEGFEAEAKAMARLNHPNLIGVYDFGEVNGMLFIIMEYVAGKSIYHAANGNAINSAEVIRLVTGVCHGLAHAHENGIIHRDIKPSNILLDSNAQPKIGDFGLARPIERKVQEGEEIFGTPHYTAPEVVNAPHTVDYRADIFSVGVMLHELLTGKLPAADPRPPSVISRCDQRFDAIVRRATHPTPAGRYASAAEMAKDLAIIATSSGQRVLRPGAAAGRGNAGPRVAAPLQPQRRMKVKKSSNSSFLLMLLLLIAGGVAAYIYFNKPLPPPEPAPADSPPADHANPDPSDLPLEPVEPEIDAEPASDSEAPAQSGTKSTRDTRSADAGETEVPTVQTPAAVPKYDVAGFFARARKIILDRAKPFIDTHTQSLSRNVDDYSRSLKRDIAKLDAGKSRQAAGESLELYIRLCQDKGYHIPPAVSEEELPNQAIQEVEHFTRLRDEFLQNESVIDNAFQKSLSSLSATYVQGMELQVGRLTTDNDMAAVDLVEKEITSIKESPDYFAGLMTGKSAAAAE